jgi:hypothetical protein
MNPLALIPYALGAYGGYKGYQQARQSGASGLGALLGGATGAYTGYTLGSAGMSMFPGSDATKAFVASQPQMLAKLPGAYNPRQQVVPFTPSSQGRQFIGQEGAIVGDPRTMTNLEKTKGGSLMDMLFRREVDGQMVTDPLKVGGLTALGLYASGAFEPGPTDIYMPGYNMGVLDIQKNRPGYSYIDPETGEEKAYEKMYLPEEAGRGERRMGNISFSQTRLKTGGLAEIKKFNEGGINYLPSKVSHDENDANNYVRASGYVEDGSGNGDKDEDTMLAQLADGEFVTRADGVLGAGIIAGANPNSMKDMREKGAKYFYEQQARYKRVFDLLKEKNGDSKQKTN